MNFCNILLSSFIIDVGDFNLFLFLEYYCIEVTLEHNACFVHLSTF